MVSDGLVFVLIFFNMLVVYQAQGRALAMSSSAGCYGFAAVCGDSLATAVTMGTVALPSMKDNKYDMSLATGSLAGGGTLVILILPDTAFISMPL